MGLELLLQNHTELYVWQDSFNMEHTTLERTQEKTQLSHRTRKKWLFNATPCVRGQGWLLSWGLSLRLVLFAHGSGAWTLFKCYKITHDANFFWLPDGDCPTCGGEAGDKLCIGGYNLGSATRVLVPVRLTMELLTHFCVLRGWRAGAPVVTALQSSRVGAF